MTPAKKRPARTSGFRALPALAEYRMLAGMTQTGLAQATGLNQPAISEIEAGSRSIRVATATKFAKALGLSLKQCVARGLLEIVRPARGGEGHHERAGTRT